MAPAEERKARQPRVACVERSVGARARRRSGVDAVGLRRLLSEVGAGLLRDQGQAGRHRPGPPSRVPPAPRRSRAVQRGRGRALPDGTSRDGRARQPGPAPAGQPEPFLDAGRPVAGDRDVPGPVGVGLLGPGEGRLGRGDRDLAAAVGPDASHPRPQGVRQGVRVRGASPADGAVRPGGHRLDALLQPPERVRGAVSHRAAAAVGGHGHGRASREPQRTEERLESRAGDRDARFAHGRRGPGSSTSVGSPAFGARRSPAGLRFWGRA